MPLLAQKKPIKNFIENLPIEKGVYKDGVKKDWLVKKINTKSKVLRSDSSKDIILSNGLIYRKFRIYPNVSTTSYKNLHSNEELIRATQPEAVVSINGKTFDVGGIKGQPNHAYLTNEWIEKSTSNTNSFILNNISVSKIKAPFSWKKKRHYNKKTKWPPEGLHLKMEFVLPKTLTAQDIDDIKNVKIYINYQLYDNIPLMSKWISVKNNSKKTITLNSFKVEKLSMVEHSSIVEDFVEGSQQSFEPDRLHLETDFAFGGGHHKIVNSHVIRFVRDPQYTSQVNFQKNTPCLLDISPTYGPEQDIMPNKEFESFMTYELSYDSDDRERRGLAQRNMYKIISPWVTENPLMMHMRNSDIKNVKGAIDQCAETGFEMLILSFGSGFDMENDDPKYLSKWKKVADYAHSKNIEIGSYSLLSSRWIDKETNIVPPEGETLAHGNCPALTSKWGQEYYKKLYNFFKKTGFDLLEHDGPYPGDVDITPRPPLQKGKDDSRWVQWRIASDFYKWCRENGIYLNTPDYYYLVGSNKCGMGYREVNWSLPRIQQQIHTRQNIYDGTWTKTNSMGWMFVPLTVYQGGGAAATIEPLNKHLDHYEMMMFSNLSLGVQACYRGLRLYDTPKTKKMVKEQVKFYKKYRTILESDLIHLKRATGRELDYMLHVDPFGREKGMLVVFNPTDKPITKEVEIPLYYTGIEKTATVYERDKNPKKYKLSRDYKINITLSSKAKYYNWYVIR